MNNMEYSKLAILDILNEFLSIYKTKLSSYWNNLSNRERELNWNIDRKSDLEINIHEIKEIISLCQKKVELVVNNFNRVVFKSGVYVITIEKVNYYYKVTLSIDYDNRTVPNMFSMNFYDKNINYNRFESSSSNYIKELYDAIEIDKKENLVYE